MGPHNSKNVDLKFCSFITNILRLEIDQQLKFVPLAMFELWYSFNGLDHVLVAHNLEKKNGKNHIVKKPRVFCCFGPKQIRWFSIFYNFVKIYMI